VQLKRAVKELQAKYPKVDLVQQVSGDFTPAAGLDQTQTVLRTHPDVDMIISAYNQNTVGAVRALKAAGKKPGEVRVFDMGGDQASIGLLKDGWVEGTMFLDPVGEVAQGIEMLVAELQGRKHPKFNDLGTGKSLRCKTTKMTPKNIDCFAR
jgi:ribose transport system substrate-binding protein